MSYRLTQTDAQHLIRRLEAAGYAMPKVGAEAVAGSWAENLGSCSAQDVTEAVNGWIRGNSRYWPKVGDLLNAAHDARRARPIDPTRTRPLAEEYWAWERRENFHEGGPCPVCGARPDWVPRLMIVHDERRHEDAGIGWVGWSRSDRKFYDEVAAFQEQQRAARPRTDDPLDREARRQKQLRRIRDLVVGGGQPSAVDATIERPVLEAVGQELAAV